MRQRARAGGRDHALEPRARARDRAGSRRRSASSSTISTNGSSPSLSRSSLTSKLGRQRRRDGRAAIVVARRRRRRRPAPATAAACERHEQGEGRAFARPRPHLQLAAEQPRDLAADREAEAGAAIFAAGRAVGLLEGLEDQLLLVLGDADAGVGDRDLDRPVDVAQHRMVGAPAAVGAAHRQRDAAVRGELERVGEQVEHDLLQPLLVGADRAGQVLVELDVEVAAPCRRRAGGRSAPCAA